MGLYGTSALSICKAKVILEEMKDAMKPIEAILLIGPTSAGKTPLGDYMQQRGILGRRCHHFDFGQELRNLAACEEPSSDFSPDEHQFIRDVLERGRFLEDEHFPLAEKIFRRFFADRGRQEQDLVVLNGLPRHAGQARDMERTVSVSHVLVLECRAEDVCARIEMNTGGDRTSRTDDSREMIREKLALYYSRTAPLMEYYSAKGCGLATLHVDAASSSESLYAQLLRLLPF
jgi:adenylate kinase family enzyme